MGAHLGVAYRGSVASIKLGTDGANNSIGDTIVVGVQIVTTALGLWIRGTSPAGAYNQNIVITGIQLTPIR